MRKILLALIILSTSLNAQVGIRTTTPSVPLDIEASDAAIDINNTAANGDPQLNFQLSGTTTFSIGIDDSDSDKLKTGTTSPSTSTKMTILTTGNVGINETAPSARLHVDGNIRIDNGNLRIDTDGDGNQAGISELNGGLALSSDADAATTTHMFIEETTGDVGVATTSPVSGLDVQTSMGLKVTTFTSATTLDNTYNVVLCNTGAYTVTLPVAASHTEKVYYIKNIDTDSDDITIDGNGAETIDGRADQVLMNYHSAIRIVSDGAGWHIISSKNRGALVVEAEAAQSSNLDLAMNATRSSSPAIDFLEITDVNGEWDDTNHDFTVGKSGAGLYQFDVSLFIQNTTGSTNYSSLHYYIDGTIANPGR